MNESERAVMESARFAAMESYFEARPQIAITRKLECIFEAGFDAAYAEVRRLREENERLRKDAERGQFLVERGEWFRHNSDTPHAYALLAIRLPYAADLSCKAMREYAIDAARGAK